MKKLMIVVAMALAVGGMSCGGGDYCTRAAPCPNDTPSTQAQITQCHAEQQANANAPCYSDAMASINCVFDNAVCGGNGQFDAVLSATKYENNCTNQKANLLSCCTKNPNSTVCR
jgi:hypothetical protein